MTKMSEPKIKTDSPTEAGIVQSDKVDAFRLKACKAGFSAAEIERLITNYNINDEDSSR